MSVFKFNKAKLYAGIENADVNKNYTHEELLALKETNKKQAEFIEPIKSEANIIGEFVENEGKLLLDSVTPKKKGKPKKEDSES